MSTMTPNEIETMARTFTRCQGEALSALGLPDRIDAEIFEVMLDQVADNIKLSEAGWDLFACTARLAFFGINEVPASDRRRWRELADTSRAIVGDEWAEDQKLQAADHRADLAREVAA